MPTNTLGFDHPKAKEQRPPYLSEPILNSELTLIKNSALLKENPSLFCDTYIGRIQKLRDDFVRIENLKLNKDTKEVGQTAKMKVIRDEIRELSLKTFIPRDNNLFGMMAMAISTGVTSRRQFSGYSFRDEMVSLSNEYILKYAHNFDTNHISPTSGQAASAFAYCTTIAVNACIQVINKWNKNNTKAKEAFLEHQKLIHPDPNRSTIGPSFSAATRTVQFPGLDHGLKGKIRNLSIKEETDIWIPCDYKITPEDYEFIKKYEYNLSIRRIKDAKDAKDAKDTKEDV